MRVLLVSAHPDDAESSCAGTISRLKEKGENIIWSIYFCPCNEDPLNDGHLEDHLKVIKYLNIDRLIENNFPRNILENYKQEVRDILFKLREEFKPDLVLCPTIHDYHQDHKALAECCLTIFRDTSTILGYEVIRSVSPDFVANFFVILQAKNVIARLNVINLYKTQMKARPYFFTEEKFKAYMEMRGVQAKTEWAEAYELMWGRIA